MWPIAVIGFSRHQYLDQTLATLVNQKTRSNGVTEDLPLDRVALFQDGAVNPKSGERYAEDDEIKKNVAVFRHHFPNAEIFQSPVNIGIAQNIDRAERWIFDELEAEAGIFFEDDMVVTKYYLQSLNALIEMARGDERIGYVACYGRGRSLYEQEKTPAKYEPLVHHWAFGLTRRQYLKSKPYVDTYLDIINERDYLKPDLEKIYQLLEHWGMGPLLPAQDVVRAAICCKTRSVRLNTYACLGKYIGADGTHHTPEVYEQMGLGDVALYPRPVTRFAALDDEEYQRFLARTESWMRLDLTPHARQWMVKMGLAERNWPDFSEHASFRWTGGRSNLDHQGRHRI